MNTTHDWRREVRKNLEACNLPTELREEVISELAAHLEETYENALAVTKNENDAIQLALGEVEDWRALAARIQRARSAGGPMNYRTKSLWMPALACISSSSLAMMLLQFADVRPQLVWTKPVAFFLYWPWLGLLPFCGALGGWLSRRAGGSIFSRLAAVLAPVLWMLALGIMVEPLELVHNGLGHLAYFAYGVGNWVVLPGIALLIGAAPFLRGRAGAYEAAELEA